MTPILILLGLPLLLALLTLPGVVRRLPLALNIGWVTGAAMALMAVLLLATAWQPVIVDQGTTVQVINWAPHYGLRLSFFIDSLALLFGLIITGVGAIVFFYTGWYFDDPLERARFIRLLLIFTAAMLWLVLSGNLITLFIAWELTSITSFLLIGFKGDKAGSARRGASQALIVTGGGGLALLVGLMMLGSAGGSYELNELLTLDLSEHPFFVPMLILILIGAFTKSAQFPFHFWLPNAMDAPTPASAFLHSATMVKAGVYLLLRLHPVLSDVPLWSQALVGVGLFTMLFCSVVAIRQDDLKGVLAFTTTAMLGAFVALIGLPSGYGIKAALVGIIAHALYKSALFLSVGSIDHAAGTRLISRLGGLWKTLPVTGAVVIVSALSMAGVPPLLGFVAKETMLEAFKSNLALLAIVFVSAASSAAAAYLLIWDVFFSRPREDLHSHPLPRLLEAGPVLLAVGTVAVALVVTPLLTPLLTPIVPVSFKLVLFPGFTEVFWLSMAVLAAGIIVFLGRNLWRRVPELRVNAAVIFEGLIGGVEWIADQALRSQSGKLRHYLVVVISVVMGILLYGGLATNLFTLEIAPLANLTPLDVVDVMLLGLAIAAATLSIRVRRHLHAVLALGTFGYAVGGVFLVEPAPDVALVQLLVETLATVVLIIMISRVSIKQRAAAMAVNARRWHLTREFLGGSRDILVAGVTGLCMFAFALMALNNVDNRTSIAEWHLENADDEVDATDVVAAIVTDFRGTDTLIEISVFAVSALGLLALLTINRRSGGEPSALSERFSQVSHVATPLVRAVAMVVLPITFMIAAVHILYGASATGDGFTAGVVAGLGVAFYYVVFGYVRVHQQLRWLRPIPILIIGLVIAMVNAWLAVLLDGAFLGYTNFLPELNVANLKLSTTLIFEVGIALAVFGAVSVIMEAIAHPAGIELPEDDADEADGPERTADSQPEAAGD